MLKRIRKLILVFCIFYTASGIFLEVSSKSGNIAKDFCQFEEMPSFFFVLAEGEPSGAEERVFLYQMDKYFENEEEYLELTGALVYKTDYGNSSRGISIDGKSISLSRWILRVMSEIGGPVGSHHGDVEMFELKLKRNKETGFYEIALLRINQHDQWRIYKQNVRCQEIKPGEMAILLYISRGKHATYPDLTTCNRQTIERCSIGSLWIPEITDEFNVGNQTHPYNPFSENEQLREVFEGEDPWSDCFWGGYEHGTGDACEATFKWSF